MPAAKPTPAAIRRAIEAMEATRLAVGALDVVRDGTVRIVASDQVRTLTSSKTRRMNETQRQGRRREADQDPHGHPARSGISVLQSKGQPLIRLPDLPMDHPDFLRAYAEAKKAVPKRAPVAAGSFAALVRAALKSDHYLQSEPANPRHVPPPL